MHLGLIKKRTIKSRSLDPLPAIFTRKCYPVLVPILKNIVNLTLASGMMPKELKSAMIRPLPTKANADTKTFSYFLPISNLRFVSKLIEKAAFLQLNEYLMRNGLQDPLQYAYKAVHSTETALIRVHNDILRSVDSGQNVIQVLLDMSAAFDTVNHEFLFTRLIALAFRRYRPGLV